MKEDFGFRNGQTIRIWDDRWIPDCPPPIYPKNNAARVDLVMVRDLMMDDGVRWDNILIGEIFPQSIAEKILSIPLCNIENNDCPSWLFSNDGRYTVKSDYWVARNLKDAKSSKPSPSFNNPKQWRWIWKLNIMPKIRIFLWKCMKGSLPTRTNLIKKCIDLSPICPRCGVKEESLEHALRDCNWSDFYWKASILRLHIDINTSTLSLQDWILSVISNQENDFVGLFASHLWMLWKSRNLLVFQNKRLDHIECFNMAASSFYEYEKIQTDHPQINHSLDYKVFWEPPPNNFIKINTDASIDNFKRVGVGGLLRREDGDVVNWFSFCVEIIPDILFAEAMACYRGIIFAANLGVSKLIVETDCQELQKTIPQSYVSNLNINIKSYIPLFTHIKFQWCKRSANRSAHELAQMALKSLPSSSLSSHFDSCITPFCNG